MSGPLSNPFMFKSSAAAGFYTHQIGTSTRNSAAQDGTLKWTAGTPTSSDTFTMSCWVKRYTTSTTDSANNIFVTGTGGGTYLYISLGADLTIEGTGGNYSGTAEMKTNAAYRDLSAWYHFVFRFDSTQSTQTNRMRIYVNGSEPTYSVQDLQAQGQNTDWSFINADGVVQAFGGLSGKGHGTEGADLQMAEIVFNDGQSYGPDSYGETKNGVWIPKDPSGLTFGNNGYWLKMASGAIGTDSSGNGNNFTVNNIAAHDTMLDSPTFGSSNGGNFCTINPLFKHEDVTISEGNLKHTCSTNQRGVMCNMQIPKSGKWYWEHLSVAFHYPTDNELHGVGVNIPSVDIDASRGGRDTGITYASNNGGKSIEADSTAAYGDGWAEGDIVGIEFDADNGTINFSNNGSWQGDISLTAAQQAKEWFPFIAMGGGTSVGVGIFNFGQDGTFAGEKTAQGNADGNGYGNFYYSPPSGALALCSGNLPTAAEVDPAETDDDYPQELFFMSQYSGNLTGRTITTENQPDLLMIRHYNTGQNWYTLDSTRVITDNKYLLTNENNAEATLPQANITSVGATSVGISSGTWLNSTGSDYQMWMWRANGGTTSSNATGDITSTVQVDPSGCFSIVKYTGESATRTIGHGLSAAPNLIIVKSIGVTRNWAVYYGDNTDALRLNTDAATDDGTYWADTSPTSTVFSVGDVSETGKSEDYIAYCFANCEGYMKFGSYVGNGNADGPFIYTGHSPSMIFVKLVASAGDWWVEDIARNTYNPADNYMAFNRSDAQANGIDIDFLSNGFKIRSTSGDFNSSGATIVYGSWAHNPFQYATAR